MERADRITKAGAVANMGMAALKGVVGTAAGSPALQADAVHSLSDLVSDGVSLWALHRARLKETKELPHTRIIAPEEAGLRNVRPEGL